VFKKILWATDFSQHARNAGEKAVECAKCSKGALYALTVVNPEDLPFILEDVPDPFIKADAIEKLNLKLEAEYEKRVLEHLDHEVQVINGSSVMVEKFLRVGTPWKEIVDLANGIGVTLIVIGSHGKHSLEEFLLGSTVSNVTKHAGCPVLVVR